MIAGRHGRPKPYGCCPSILIRVTDENGVERRPGRAWHQPARAGETQSGVAVRFGGETGVVGDRGCHHDHAGHAGPGMSGSATRSAGTPSTTSTRRRTTVDARFARNWKHGLRTGVTGDVLAIDTGSSGASLSADGKDVIPTVGAFLTLDTLDSSTNPRDGTWAEVEVDRLFGDARVVDVHPRRTADSSGCRSAHGLGLFSLATFQTGEVGVEPADLSAVRARRRQQRARLGPGIAARPQSVHRQPRIHLRRATGARLFRRRPEPVRRAAVRGVRRPRRGRGTAATMSTRRVGDRRLRRRAAASWCRLST